MSSLKAEGSTWQENTFAAHLRHLITWKTATTAVQPAWIWAGSGSRRKGKPLAPVVLLTSVDSMVGSVAASSAPGSRSGVRALGSSATGLDEGETESSSAMASEVLSCPCWCSAASFPLLFLIASTWRSKFTASVLLTCKQIGSAFSALWCVSQSLLLTFSEGLCCSEERA